MQANSPFKWDARVYYEDTDAGGIVYYANYLKFMERARSEWVRSLDINQATLIEEQNIIFVVGNVNITYKSPAKLEDELTISVDPVKFGKAGFELIQQVHNKADGKLLTEATVKIVCVKADTLKPIAIPSQVKEKMEAKGG